MPKARPTRASAADEGVRPTLVRSGERRQGPRGRHRLQRHRDYLKAHLQRGEEAEFEEAKLRDALYRPFTRKYVYYDRILVHRPARFDEYFSPDYENIVLVMSDIAYRAQSWTCLVADCIPDLHLCAAIDGHQCFPLSHLSGSTLEPFPNRKPSSRGHHAPTSRALRRRQSLPFTRLRRASRRSFSSGALFRARCIF
jgi:hypothetical protein